MPKSLNEYTEKELVELFQSGEKEAAFRQIVKLYQERLYWHIRKIVVVHEDSDDVLQNTFIKVWKALDSFRLESQLFTWLYRIATNESLTLLSKKKKNTLISFDNQDFDMYNSMRSDEYFNGNDAQAKLQKVLLKLPEKQRIVFNMKYFDHLKYEEMAGILGTSVGSLKASYHHAVKKIEKFITET